TAEMLTPKSHELLPAVKYFQITARILSGDFVRAGQDAAAMLRLGLGRAWEERLYVIATEAFEQAGRDKDVIALYEKYERRVPAAKRSEPVMHRAVKAY